LWHHAGSLKRFCRRGITIMKFWRWSFALLCGRRNQTERAAHLNGSEERFAGIALWAFEGAQIETRFVRLDAGQPHRFAAFGAVQNSDRYSAKNWIGLSGQHDAPLGPGGSATLSVTDRCQWWGGDRTSIFLGFHTCWSILLIFKITTLPGHDN